MSEKRFTYLTGAMGVLFYDGDEMIPYPKVCEILNKVDEQQAIIQSLKEENEQLRQENKEYEEIQTEINYFIVTQGIGTKFVKFLKGEYDE